MSDFIVVNAEDNRYNTLQKGFNLRWPTSGEGANYIYVCHSANAVIEAANDALSKGYRITVRSGGHCYEGFVANKLTGESNQPLAIIDLSLMTGLQYSAEGNVASPWDPNSTYKLGLPTGNQNWDGYVGLYKTAGLTVPGGSCYSVGSGGHVSGGGYGLLSRLHGLTVDWLSGVDILVPDPANPSSSLIVKHVNLNSTGTDRDLFIACRGAGGGNFGIILNYYYSDLPTAPKEVYLLTLSFPWDSFGQGEEGKRRFSNFLLAYWIYFKAADRLWNDPDPQVGNGGLFSLLKLQHRSTGDVQLLVQYTGNDGTLDGINAAPFVDFVNKMTEAAECTPYVTQQSMIPGKGDIRTGKEKLLEDPLKDLRRMDWLYATQTLNGSGSNQRGKYKSVYHRDEFTQQFIDTMWTVLNGEDNPLLNQFLVQIDSYGGCINDNNEETNPTSVYQRNSILKSQFQIYWTDASLDTDYVQFMEEFYRDCFYDIGGKPYDLPDKKYQGCYINYPDIDMKYKYDTEKEIDPQWLTLHYGDKAEKLVATKQAVDPHNIFRHEMSIPLVLP